MMSKKLARYVFPGSTIAIWLSGASNVFAQTATSSGKGGTSSSLPNAGTAELTYMIFIAGVLLFVFGILKFIGSLRES